MNDSTNRMLLRSIIDFTHYINIITYKKLRRSNLFIEHVYSTYSELLLSIVDFTYYTNIITYKKLRRSILFEENIQPTHPELRRSDLFEGIYCRTLIIKLRNKAQKKAMEKIHGLFLLL